MKNADQPVFTQDLNAVMIEFAKEEGIELTLNRKGEISSKFLIGTIRYEFDLSDLYVTQTTDGKRCQSGRKSRAYCIPGILCQHDPVSKQIHGMTCRCKNQWSRDIHYLK